MTVKKRNKENDSLYRKKLVKLMKNKTNCENNVELLSLETRNLLHGHMTKEIRFLENYRMGWNTRNAGLWTKMRYTYTYYLTT